MNKPKVILPLILLFLWSSKTLGQEKDLKEILVTAPEIIVADDSIMKYLIDYENTFYLPLNDGEQGYYLKKSKKKKFPDHVKQYLKYQASFSHNHTLANSVTSLVAHSLQMSENNQNYNLLTIPLRFSPGKSQTELEELCIQDTADFIVFIYMVKFTMKDEKNKHLIYADPTFYLYSHHEKKVVYNPIFPVPEVDNELAKLFASSIGGERKKYRFIILGARDIVNIIEYLNQWRPSPSI